MAAVPAPATSSWRLLIFVSPEWASVAGALTRYVLHHCGCEGHARGGFPSGGKTARAEHLSIPLRHSKRTLAEFIRRWWQSGEVHARTTNAPVRATNGDNVNA